METVLESASSLEASNVGFLDKEQKEKLCSVLTANYEIPGMDLPPLSVR